MRRDLAVWLLIAVGAALAVIAIGRPDLFTGGQGVRLLYLMLLLAYIGSAALTGARRGRSRPLVYAVVWLAVIVALVGGYRLWESWR